MKLIGIIAVLAAALTVGSVAAVGAAPSDTARSAAVREFEGTVVSVNRDARTFRLRDTERGTARIKVTRSTDFERLAGFSALRPGLRRIEATVRRSNGQWIALEVERSGGGGEHGGDDDDGNDDDRRGDDDHGGGDDDSSGPGGGDDR